MAQPKPRHYGIEPLVSLVIRTYNRPHYLRDCLYSVTAQDYTNLETVLVWNGGRHQVVSAPNLVEVKIPRATLGAAMNAGIAAASGAYIYVLDDDDVLLPDAISRSVELAEKERADLVFSDLLCFTENARAAGVFVSEVQTFSECLLAKRIPHPSSMYRRSFLVTHSLAYDSQYSNAEDYDFILAFLRMNPIIDRLEEPVYRYRIHATQQYRTKTEWLNAMRIQSKWRRISAIPDPARDSPLDQRKATDGAFG